MAAVPAGSWPVLARKLHISVGSLLPFPLFGLGDCGDAELGCEVVELVVADAIPAVSPAHRSPVSPTDTPSGPAYAYHPADNGSRRRPTALESAARAYLVAGAEEPFFHENAKRWTHALHGAGADVVMTTRAGAHGGAS